MMSHSTQSHTQSAPAGSSIGSKVKHLYEQIEAIKSTISMSNSSRPELWIQRQNLQDLYHQIILSDIDFSIDKKLEQDLWNLVFKSQINYFQSQIKESSLSSSSGGGGGGGGVGVVGGGGGGGGGNVGGSSNVNVASSSAAQRVSSQKRIEAQASLFFLEAARGFYTKLIQDIVFAYDYHDTDYLLPFCQRFLATFDKINSLKTGKTKNLDSANNLNREKQILYICQHILTHLGDLARYANLFQQAKNYYLHAVKLVPYLGHPYNQLGILFETSRTNQLSTVFYYIRSIAVRYTFPLASTNLDNFFAKLVDIPLTRYNPTQLDPGSVKLAHKDLITLYLQINAIIYKASNSADAKLTALIQLFRSTFSSFMRTPLQRDKLDALQVCQMMCVLMFVLNSASLNKTNENHCELLIAYFFNEFTLLLTEKKDYLKLAEDILLPGFYLLLCFLEGYKEGGMISENRVWLNVGEAAVSAKLLNGLEASVGDLRSRLVDIDEVKLEECPLNEDRLTDSFVPLKSSQQRLNFKKYNRGAQLFNELEECLIRAKRVLACFERVCVKNPNCFIQMSKCEEDEARFSVSESSLRPEKKEVAPNVSENKTQAPPRRRRQNVAIQSITQIKQQQEALKSAQLLVQEQKLNQIIQQPLLTNNESIAQQQQLKNNFNQLQPQSLLTQNFPNYQPKSMQDSSNLLKTVNLSQYSNSASSSLSTISNLPSSSTSTAASTTCTTGAAQSFFPSASMRQFSQPQTNLIRSIASYDNFEASKVHNQPTHAPNLTRNSSGQNQHNQNFFQNENNFQNFSTIYEQIQHLQQQQQQQKQIQMFNLNLINNEQNAHQQSLNPQQQQQQQQQRQRAQTTPNQTFFQQPYNQQQQQQQPRELNAVLFPMRQEIKQNVGLNNASNELGLFVEPSTTTPQVSHTNGGNIYKPTGAQSDLLNNLTANRAIGKIWSNNEQLQTNLANIQQNMNKFNLSQVVAQSHTENDESLLSNILIRMNPNFLTNNPASTQTENLNLTSSSLTSFLTNHRSPLNSNEPFHANSLSSNSQSSIWSYSNEANPDSQYQKSQRF